MPRLADCQTVCTLRDRAGSDGALAAQSACAPSRNPSRNPSECCWQVAVLHLTRKTMTTIGRWTSGAMARGAPEQLKQVDVVQARGEKEVVDREHARRGVFRPGAPGSRGGPLRRRAGRPVGQPRLQAAEQRPGQAEQRLDVPAVACAPAQSARLPCTSRSCGP